MLITLAYFSRRRFASVTNSADGQCRRLSQRVFTRREIAVSPSRYDVPTRYDATTSVNQ
jgi:hypothetical protein